MTVLRLSGVGFDVRPHFWSRRKTLLEDVSLEVRPAEIFGFLGPNGAGKTTTIKTALGLIRASRGTIEVLGQPAGDTATRQRLGFMPERAYFPEYLTGHELVLQHALLSGRSWADSRRLAKSALERVGLARSGAARLGTYSKGMLQRAGLAQALVGEPELVILDEPMSGLDPAGRRDVRHIMNELREAGTTVFFSTHILPDVEMVCDHIAILVGGRVRKSGSLGALLEETVAAVDVTVEECADELAQQLTSLASAVNRHPRGITFTAADPNAANVLIDRFRAAHVAVVRVETQRRSLEELFLSETEDASS